MNALIALLFEGDDHEQQQHHRRIERRLFRNNLDNLMDMNDRESYNQNKNSFSIFYLFICF